MHSSDLCPLYYCPPKCICPPEDNYVIPDTPLNSFFDKYLEVDYSFSGCSFTNNTSCPRIDVSTIINDGYWDIRIVMVSKCDEHCCSVDDCGCEKRCLCLKFPLVTLYKWLHIVYDTPYECEMKMFPYLDDSDLSEEDIKFIGFIRGIISYLSYIALISKKYVACDICTPVKCNYLYITLSDMYQMDLLFMILYIGSCKDQSLMISIGLGWNRTWREIIHNKISGCCHVKELFPYYHSAYCQISLILSPHWKMMRLVEDLNRKIDRLCLSS